MSAAAILLIGVVLLFLTQINNDAPSADPAAQAAANTPPLRVRPTGPLASSVEAPARAASPAPGIGQSAARPHAADQTAAATAAVFKGVATVVQDFALGDALEQNASNADAYVDRFCAESAALRDRPVLGDLPRRGRDAAEFMAPLIDYEKPLDNPPGRLHLPDELRERITSYGPKWPIRITDADLTGLDFSWMASLGQFDHWTLLGAGRLRDVAPGNIFRDPIPNYVSLMLWSKLRFALGLRRRDLISASAEVRQLADLIQSQGILIAEMIAVAMYKMDARARELATAAGLDVQGWDQLEVDQLERYRQAIYASIFFTFPGVRPETVKKALACTLSPCVALVEGAGANRSFGAYGATENLRLQQQIAAVHDCEDALLARASDSQEIAANEALEVAARDLASQIAKHLDTVR